MWDIAKTSNKKYRSSNRKLVQSSFNISPLKLFQFETLYPKRNLNFMQINRFHSNRDVIFVIGFYSNLLPVATQIIDT